jgi:UDP-N-acetylmuramoylalanine--D-glutamate ligase
VRDLNGKKVTVVGLGASGIAAVRLCVARGAKVTGTDGKARAQASADMLALEALGVTLALGGHAQAGLENADLIVVSPGVPSFAELVQAEKKGVPVISEIELATSQLTHPAKIVAIGGTNGKSTVTSLVAALLEGAGKKVFAGGNLGEPLASHADQAFDVVVLEVSSFQLERLATFKPSVSVLLNVTADHLDRYPDMAAYAAAKGNAFVRQDAGDVAVIPAGDDVCKVQASRGGGKLVTFGAGSADVVVTRDAVTDTRRGLTVRTADVRLSGGHNALNVAAALAAVAPFELPEASIRQTLRTFQGLPHRMAYVETVSGVRYYDDSKGTNVGAVVTALAGLAEDKCVLIAGGKDKGGGYAELADALKTKGRGVVVIGEAAPLIQHELAEKLPGLPVVPAKTMEDAVSAAAELAFEGDAVLLSPACASFDMFKDYKHRGDVFVAAVKAMCSLALTTGAPKVTEKNP